MSRFAVQITRAAARDLDRLPESAREQVCQDLRTLQDEPTGSPPRVRRLKGFPFALYRLRTTDHGVLYRLDRSTVTVMRVIDWKDLARILRQT
ncbi:MAG: type II toxin-antitoxin system RelE/ParE family toxin [bacterium]|nr:type II toxin-antitoxin system RelE/ParE family toxin [bacterium]